MPFQDLPQFLEKLEKEKELIRIKKEVDPVQEISAIIIKVKEPAVLCEKVKGYDIPVVGNVFGNRRKVEMALELPKENQLDEYWRRMEQLIPPKLIADGPVKEKVYLGKELDLMSCLPIPVVNEKDGGPYIDCGIAVAKDPQFGNNLALHRIHIKGKRKAGILLEPFQHLNRYYKRREEKNEPLEIAVIIGCDPVLYVASVVTGAPDLDEYSVAGALRGQAVEMVKCQTVDLEVPAYAEIILEGKILPHLREPEGPFGEYSGYYGPVGDRPVIEFTALTHRSRPIFQMLYEGKPPSENNFLTSIPKAADVYQLVKRVAPEVKDAYLTLGGCGRYHAVVKMKKRFEGEPKMALGTLLSSKLGIKHAVVVDEDINIYDPNDVEWAVATRSQFDRDSVVILDVPVMLDPSTELKRKTGNLTAKVGIDATVPLGEPYAEVCDVSNTVKEKVEKNWKEYIG